jgi:hypothetical protein
MKSLSYVFGPNETTTVSNANSVSLHCLVDRLMESFVPLAVSKHSFIINDIHPGLSMEADEQVLAFVVGNLLKNMINSSKNVCIRVEAVRKDNCLQVRVRNNGNYFYSTIANSFGPIVAAAKKLGGYIDIYNQQHEGTVITLSMAA